MHYRMGGTSMTEKKAAKFAKKYYGPLAGVECRARESFPFCVGIKGPFALDIRGRGNSWEEAFRNAAQAESDGAEKRRRKS